jgi:hypothetical protein
VEIGTGKDPDAVIVPDHHTALLGLVGKTISKPIDPIGIENVIAIPTGMEGGATETMRGRGGEVERLKDAVKEVLDMKNLGVEEVPPWLRTLIPQGSDPQLRQLRRGSRLQI